MNRKFASVKEVILIVIAGAVALGAYFLLNSGNKGVYGEILHENTLIERVDLSGDGVFTVQGFENVVFEVREGAIAFKSSDCPDKICVNTGYINRAGQSAVCLPNRLTLRIAGGDGGMDAYTG